jgi:nicotinamidase-related amidase
MADLDRQSQGLGSRPALLLVDLIESFTDPDCPLGCAADGVVEANRQLLQAFRDKGLPVAFTTVVYHDDRQARVFRDRVPALEILKPGTRWVNIDARVAPVPGEPVFEKCWASAFFETGLDEYLRGQGVDSLVVTGLTTSGCVRASAVDGLQHDYRVVIPAEAVGDRNEDAHRANLFDLNAKYADVLDLKEVLAIIEAL